MQGIPGTKPERVLIHEGYQNLFRFLEPGPAVYGGVPLTAL
ncbi:hypothetical protein [Methylobacterium sp. Leaf123]|nr:hypothetical protein [Methylobacterium sp. Leaf123]